MTVLSLSIEQTLDRIRLAVEATFEGLVAVEGRSGAGKSSLLRAIAGLTDSARGWIEVDGGVWLGGKRALKPEARSIGYLAQDAALFPNLTALENVAFVLPGNAVKRRDHARGLLASFGLEDLVSAMPDQLSGGQRRRIALVRAVAPERQVYLLDEPFSSLDADAAALTAEALATLLNGRDRPCLITCHDAGKLDKLCARAITLTHGSVTGTRSLSGGRRLSDRRAQTRSTRARGAEPAATRRGLLSTPSGFRGGSR